MLYFTGIRKLPLQMREWTVPHGNTEDKHMLKHSKRGLQTILFYRFLAISAALLIVISSIVYMIQYSILYKNMENDILRTTTSVGDSIDLQISQMDNICLNVINSTTVKSTFALWQNMDASSYERSKQQNALSNALVSIRGVDSSIRQVNIYPVEGSGYGIGNYYGILPLQAEELPWYTPAIEKNGYRYISSSSNPLLSKKNPSLDKISFIKATVFTKKILSVLIKITFIVSLLLLKENTKYFVCELLGIKTTHNFF